MNHNQRNPGPIPQRWLNCPRKSVELIANKFIAFKTPLDHRYDGQVPNHCRFSPQFLFDLAKTYKWEIGLWIDLTNTKRYYDEEDIKKRGCTYKKLPCRGHEGAPSEDQTTLFVQLCHDFISYNPLKVIGIHCTHGFNRTGFLIVSYLVRKLDWSVDAALMHFSKLRPPGIYKRDYLLELYKRYDDEANAPDPPELPDWCLEGVDGVDDDDPIGYGGNEDTIHSSGEKSSRGRGRKEDIKANPTFMPGVPGVAAITDMPKLTRIQKKVQDMCGWKKAGFPGSQPVSMDLTNIVLLNQKPYKVSWKADGTRYMMLIEKENQIYFVDRNNSIFEVAGLKFPHIKDPKRHLTDTLLDGEMVIDKVDGKDIPRYLAYDVIKYENRDVGKETFDVRLNCLDKEIVQARYIAMREGRINRTQEPFSVRLKQFWDVTQAGSLLSDKFAKSLSHEPDGLIFQPAKDPYKAGQCDQVLKWKPLLLNSVDFKLHIGKESGPGILPRKVGLLYVCDLNIPYSSMTFTKSLAELNNKIIECKFENNSWVFMRERTDKSHANSYHTAEAVCSSIRDPVTQEYLLDYIDRYRFSSDHDMMPPPRKVPRK